jgi:hypothetical protein
MGNYKSLSASGLFGLFFTMQAIGYLHGSGIYGQANIENTLAFGIYHLSHIFQPHKPLAWPLSPFLCGFVLLCIPFMEKDKSKEKLSAILLALLLPLSIAILEVSIIGPEEAASFTNQLSQSLEYPILLSILYFFLYAVLFAACWRYRSFIKKRLDSLVHSFSKPLLFTVAAAWLLYGCYVGSRFDGALDHIKGEHALIRQFFPAGPPE